VDANMGEDDPEGFEAEARKLREIARCAQASVYEAVEMARRGNWRAAQAGIISIAAIVVAVVCVAVAYLL
jgi:hypothetical protein